MENKHLPVAFEVLESYAQIFRNLFQEITGKALPPDTELNHNCFEKNDLSRTLRDVINQAMGAQLAFHPLKLYHYVFKHLRFKERNEFSRFQKHPDGAVIWKVTKIFPDMLFQLLGYQNLEDFIKRESSRLGEEVVLRQRQYIKQYYVTRQHTGRQAVAFYHCYISDLKGLKIGKLAVFNDDTVELILNDRDLSHYCGLIKKNTNWSAMDFWKIQKRTFKASCRKLPSNQAFEVSFKFLPEEDFQEHIFIFGTYSAINRNDYDIKNPARVAGSIMLEWINVERPENMDFLSLPFIKPDQIDPIIAAKVSGKRIEELKTYMRKSSAEDFLERRKEELQLINANNHTAF